MQEWLTMPAAELGRGIGAGRIAPEALADVLLEAIGAHPEAGRIYARLTPERARAEAAAAGARAREGRRLSPLDGVPVSWKDLFDTAGVGTEAGSALLKGRVPQTDALALQRATAMGLVCLGKTHMSELAFSGLGLNPVTETPPCALAEGLAPGGSSSGAAASVAFGLAPAGVGSDTGGSVRVPSAWNGLVGLKTTAGRLPLDGVVPLAARFDTVGPLVRTVEDAALMLAALEGRAGQTPEAAPLRGMRLAVLESIALDGLDAPVREGFEAACDALRRAGAELVPLRAPFLEEAMGLAPVLYTYEAWQTWGTQISADPEAMYAPVRKRFEAGATFSRAEYDAAWETLERLRRAWLETAAPFEAVLCPTVAIMPPAVAPLLADESDYTAVNLLALRNTRIGNLMGLAALTLPAPGNCGGITLMGRPWSEERLLHLGAGVERALA